MRTSNFISNTMEYFGIKEMKLQDQVIQDQKTVKRKEVRIS